MSVKSEGLVAGDVLKWVVDNEYAIEQCTVEGTAADELLVGYILETGAAKQYKRLATAANANAVLLEKITIPAAGFCNAVVLVRGPAVVDKSRLNYNSQTASTVDAALKALHIVPRSEPTYTTQTT